MQSKAREVHQRVHEYKIAYLLQAHVAAGAVPTDLAARRFASLQTAIDAIVKYIYEWQGVDYHICGRNLDAALKHVELSSNVNENTGAVSMLAALAAEDEEVRRLIYELLEPKVLCIMPSELELKQLIEYVFKLLEMRRESDI